MSKLICDSATYSNRRRTAADVMRTDILEGGAHGLPVNCKLIEQDPGSVLRPHFHWVDQFQVFVRGGGKIGRHPADPVTVHFTKAQTPYGPLAAGDNGLHYIVVRAETDSGAEWMPDSASKADKNAVRGHVISSPAPPRSSGMRAELSNALRSDLLPPSAEGMSAVRFILPPHASAVSPGPGDGRGLFLLVTSGAAIESGITLAVNSCIYASPDEPAFAFQAGDDGAEVIALSFPKLS